MFHSPHRLALCQFNLRTYSTLWRLGGVDATRFIKKNSGHTSFVPVNKIQSGELYRHSWHHGTVREVKKNDRTYERSKMSSDVRRL